MTKDEAMKLALVALMRSRKAVSDDLDLAGCAYGKNDPDGHRYADAKTTLVTLDKAITDLQEALAEQPAQQEPVAWMHVMDNTEGIKANGTGVTSYTQKQKHPFGKPGIDFSKSYPITSTPLYTSPPAQRKPLTDEEIDRMYVSCKYGSVRELARAIEAAHFIKGGA